MCHAYKANMLPVLIEPGLLYRFYPSPFAAPWRDPDLDFKGMA